MTEIIIRELTAEEIAEREAWAAGAYDRECEQVRLERHAAYVAPDGSDALLAKFMLGEDGVTLDDVQARKDEINAAHPYPVKPKK
jgi:hypothetical protein